MNPVDLARSAQMARVRGIDTKPEMRVRKALHAAGLRYRLHDRRLPGTPDLVFPSRRIALFVHGCFWHRHPGCAAARLRGCRNHARSFGGRSSPATSSATSATAPPLRRRTGE